MIFYNMIHHQHIEYRFIEKNTIGAIIIKMSYKKRSNKIFLTKTDGS